MIFINLILQKYAVWAIYPKKKHFISIIVEKNDITHFTFFIRYRTVRVAKECAGRVPRCIGTVPEYFMIDAWRNKK